MRLTILLLLATVLVASGGVYYVNHCVGGEEEAGEVGSPQSRFALPETVEASKPILDKETVYVSGCYDSGDHCRCLDPRGNRVPESNITDADCRAMLKIAPH